MIASRQPIYLIALWVTTAFLLSALILFFTPRGLGMSPDSVAYLKSVQGLLQGLGSAYFSVQWPPLYALLIALASQAVGDDFYLGSRIVNSVLYGAFFILTGALLRQITTSFSYLAYFFAGLLLLHPLTTHIYFYAFSEALFLPLVILNFILLGGLVSTDKKLRGQLVIALMVVVFTANLARYAGLCLVALNVLALYLSAPRHQTRQNFVEILIQVLPTALFLFLWRQRLGIGDTETNLRPFVVHLITVENINQGLVNIGHWLLAFVKLHEVPSLRPLCWGLGAIILGFILFVASTATAKIYACRRNNSFLPTELWVRFLLATFTLGYLLFLILMRSFFDPNIIFDNRMLSPIFLPIIIVILAQLNNLQRVAYRAIAIAFVSGLLALSLQTMRPWLLINYFNGVELSDKNRLDSKLLSFLRSCPRAAIVYADQPWNVNLEFNSMVHWLPTQRLYGSWLPNLRYEQQVSALTSLADMIVVENLHADIIQSIERLKTFRRVYVSGVGIVWANIRVDPNYCPGQPLN
jgi:hypothetical protein